MDPDNTMLPVGFRQRDQTAKEPTGELSSDKLMNFLEEEGAAVPDKEEEVAYEAGTKRGKVFKIPEKIVSDNPYANESSGKVELEPEVEKALADATDLELTDLAAVLGLHKMLNNEQYYNSLASSEMVSTISFNQATKCKLPVCPPEEMQKIEENPTDPHEMLDLLNRNDPSVDEVNLNNIPNISVSTLQSYGEVL